MNYSIPEYIDTDQLLQFFEQCLTVALKKGASDLEAVTYGLVRCIEVHQPAMRGQTKRPQQPVEETAQGPNAITP